MIDDKNISVPDIQSPKEVSKIKKHSVHQFYSHSYYLIIHNKTTYYPTDDFSICANGFNSYTYSFIVTKDSNIIHYALNKHEPNIGLSRFDVVYKMIV
jgi:hypothetical protein